MKPTIQNILSISINIFPFLNEIKRFAWGLKEKKDFSARLNDLEVKYIISSRSRKYETEGPTFCIVHWNAPDFLFLNVKQLDLIYPKSKIYILDNGSKQLILEKLIHFLSQFKNVTLLSVRSGATSDHTKGLQVLLNYSALQQDEFAIFLDQDSILCRRIDDLLMKFCSQKDLLIIGARDYVVIAKEHRGLINYKFLRNAPPMIHPSLMILQPRKIVDVFGNLAFSFDPKAWEEANESYWKFEPYYSLFYKARGRVLFLESKMHTEIPLLTGYYYDNVFYAYHAWYSSRTTTYFE